MVTDILQIKLRDQNDPPSKPFKPMKDPVLEAARKDFKKRWGYKPVGMSLETIHRKLAGLPEPVQDTVIRREGKVPVVKRIKKDAPTEDPEKN